MITKILNEIGIPLDSPVGMLAVQIGDEVEKRGMTVIRRQFGTARHNTLRIYWIVFTGNEDEIPDVAGGNGKDLFILPDDAEGVIFNVKEGPGRRTVSYRALTGLLKKVRALPDPTVPQPEPAVASPVEEQAVPAVIDLAVG